MKKQKPRATRAQLVTALTDCHDAMVMQLKREAGEFHITAQTAGYIWENALRRAKSALEAERA